MCVTWMAINQGKVNRWMQGRKKETNITLKKRKRTEAVSLPKNNIIRKHPDAEVKW